MAKTRAVGQDIENDYDLVGDCTPQHQRLTLFYSIYMSKYVLEMDNVGIHVHIKATLLLFNNNNNNIIM